MIETAISAFLDVPLKKNIINIIQSTVQHISQHQLKPKAKLNKIPITHNKGTGIHKSDECMIAQIENIAVVHQIHDMET